MADALFSLKGDLPADVVLVGFRGREELSRPFELEIFVTSADAQGLEDAVAQKLSLEFNHPPARALHGVISGVDILLEQTERSLARLVVVPRVQLLALSKHSQVFTEQKIPDIIKQVLEAAGLTSNDFELQLDGDYPPEAHVCQYQESDLDFITRWMEHEGMHYRFDHSGEADKLIISDGAVGDPLTKKPVRYAAGGGGDHSAGEAFHRFRRRNRQQPKKVTLTDYDYENPSLDVKGEAEAYGGGKVEVTAHRDDRFFTPKRGKALAKIRAQELLAAQSVATGRARCFHLAAGHGFDLDGHPVSWLNGSYLCTSIRHQGSMASTTAQMAALTGLEHGVEYQADITAIVDTVTYRPPRRTPKPRVYGFESGVIDGPADSDYAQIDDQGRYRVILNLDESGLDSGKASTCIRMMQPHGGNPEGFHFPLRKGTEVMIAFLAGDPDRPVIAGAVPNALNPSVVTADNHSRNVIHTGGDNRIEMEDQEGKQWIVLNTPTQKTHLHLGLPHDDKTHHFEFHTDGNCKFQIDSNQDILVGGHLKETVQGAVTETYKATQTSMVTGPQSTEVKKDGCVETYGATQLTMTVGQVTEDYQTAQDTVVNAKPRTELFLSSQATTVNDAILEQQFNDSHTRTVLGSTSTTHLGKLTRHATGATVMMYPASLFRLCGPTKRTYKSLGWVIPASTTVVASSCEVTVPSDLWTFVSNMKISLLKIEMSLANFGAAGAKFEMAGIALGETGIKYEACGVALGGTGFSCGISALSSKSEAAVLWEFPKASNTT